MSTGIGDADRITVTTQDGKQYQFDCNEITITIDVDYERYGSGAVGTIVPAERRVEIKGEIFCTKHPKFG